MFDILAHFARWRRRRLPRVSVKLDVFVPGTDRRAVLHWRPE